MTGLIPPDAVSGWRDRLPEGTLTTGRVVQRVLFGIFIELEDGAVGLAHSTWGRRLQRRGDARRG